MKTAFQGCYIQCMVVYLVSCMLIVSMKKYISEVPVLSNLGITYSADQWKAVETCRNRGLVEISVRLRCKVRELT
jgi:hypothetical protein